MRYQERIYAQTDNTGVRNKDILNVNMSSDICVFESPKFDISGATKIHCDSETCNFSNYNPTNILTAATNTCLSAVSITCITGTTWETKIYENSIIAYSGIFFTTATSGNTPPNSYFINSVCSGLTSLGYTYTNSGTTFTINKKSNILTLEIDICLHFSINISGNTCPVGYSATPAGDACVRIITTGSTFAGSGSTISAGTMDIVYGSYGAYFYPNIQNNGALPVFYQSALLKNQTGGTISALAVNASNPFWFNSGTTVNGRLNNVGLSASSTEYLGFAYCFDIQTGGTYYIGLAADNYCKFNIDGLLIANFSATTNDNFKFWSIFPFEFTSGKHIIEMVGKNATSQTAFGAEIYNPTSLAVLTAATSTGASQANVIFTTKSFIGGHWDLGTTVGYTCPSGYTLDTCSGHTCIKITTTGISTTCSGTCPDNCTTLCLDTFEYLSSASTGVYIFDTTTATTLPLTFNFTANTEAFTEYNANFKYEIYKYNPSIGVFTIPPIYKSDTIYYSTFSGNNILTQSIPLTAISMDGNYLVKGYYEADACTDFLNRLGKKIETIVYKNGSEYQLYDPALDYYFISTTKADKPIFTQTQSSELSSYDGLPLYQQVILVDDLSDFVITNGQGDNNIQQTGNTYTRTGSTITLNSEYIGNIIVTLNGSSLSKDLDYTLSGTILTFYGDIINGDVITIIYTRSSTLTIVADTIQIKTTIASGATNTQGINRSFYNGTTGKYEVYTENEPLDFSKIIVLLNGATLASDIDYYQSTTNPNRIILNGTLLVGDIITIVYYPKANVINGITQASNLISWYIPTPPQDDNGLFSLEYSTNATFGTYSVSSTVIYQTLVTNYSSLLTITGPVGTRLYYRVKNEKNYKTICGDMIKSVNYSEVVPIVIQSNAINTY